MPGWSVQILQDQVSPRLVGITERIQAGILRGLDSTGSELVKTARGIVPVRTGFLRDSIYFMSGVAEGNMFTMVFGAGADYAFFR
jgi:hypothetical protein